MRLRFEVTRKDTERCMDIIRRKYNFPAMKYYMFVYIKEERKKIQENVFNE